jgi:fatty acid desaturase
LGYSIHTHAFTINSRRIATPVSGLLSGKRHATPNLLCLIGAALFLPFTFVFLEALLMASNTSYHKCLHGSRRFAYHILALFTARRCLVVLAHDLEHEGNIFHCFM